MLVTKRFMLAWLQAPSRRSASLMRLDEVHGVLDRDDLLGGIVRNLAAEFLLECHHQLDRVEAVGSEVVDEAGIFGNFALIDAKMLHHNLFHSLGDIAHRFISSTENALVTETLWAARAMQGDASAGAACPDGESAVT
jgi:hypothetical protein